MKQVISCLLILVVPFGPLSATHPESPTDSLFEEDEIVYENPPPGYLESKYFSDKNHPYYCCENCGCFPCECTPYDPSSDCCQNPCYEDPCCDLICATCDPCCSPCAPVCGTECGVSIFAVAAGIVAITAIGVLIVSLSEHTSSEHS